LRDKANLNRQRSKPRNYFFRYLPAILNANEGSIIKAVTNSSLINNSLSQVSFLSGPDAVKTTKIPIMPKTIEAPMKILVAIFCIVNN